MVLRYRAEAEDDGITPPKPRNLPPLQQQGSSEGLDGTVSESSKDFLPLDLRPTPPAEPKESKERPGHTGSRLSSKSVEIQEPNEPHEPRSRSKDFRRTISRMISIQRLSTRRSMASTGVEADHLRDYLSFLYRQAEQLLLWEKLDAKMAKADDVRKPVIELCSRASFNQMKSLRTSCFDAALEEDVDRSEADDFSPDQITSSAQLRRFSNMSDARVRRQSAFVIQMPQEEEPFDEQEEGAWPSSPQDSQQVRGAKSGRDGEGDAKSTRAADRGPGGGAACSVPAVHPLKEAMTKRKVNLAEVREILKQMDLATWLEAPLEPDSKGFLPRALVVAVGENNAELVGMLVEFGANVTEPYEGESNFKGWIKPGAQLLTSVSNRKGRFVGTMLAERLEKIEELLSAALQAPDDPQVDMPEEDMSSSPSQSRSAFRAISSTWSPGELCRHTRSHPIGVYEILEHLGDGDTSTVWAGWHLESSASVAIKIEAKSDEGGMWDEIELMRKLRHPNVCRLFETFETETQVFMVLDLCLGGRLYDVLAMDGGQICRAKRLLKQLAEAVACLHAHKICHRDIQLENFLLVELEAPLEEATVRLIDFTTSKDYSGGQALLTKICTPTYVAKEILTRKMEPYTEKVDVWSLGVVFFILCSGHPPFQGETDFDVLKQVKKGVWTFEPESAWDDCPDEVMDLIQHMITPLPERFSAQQVLHHAFLAA